MKRTVTITEFRRRTGKILDLVQKNQRPIVVTKRGKPVFVVAPMPDDLENWKDRP